MLKLNILVLKFNITLSLLLSPAMVNRRAS